MTVDEYLASSEGDQWAADQLSQARHVDFLKSRIPSRRSLLRHCKKVHGLTRQDVEDFETLLEAHQVADWVLFNRTLKLLLMSLNLHAMGKSK